jgi:toxin-antitoxin system PIN domain toxin
MIIPDVNLLIYAYDSISPLHSKSREWWENVLSGDEPVGIPWVVVLAFTRLMTHPTLCTNPLTPEQVRERVDIWLEQPHVRMLSPAPETIRTFFELLESAGMGGNLSTDALIAAHAIENSGTVYSNDRDFGRFEGLKWINPLQ